MKINHYIFLILLGLIISTCKKFPEDKFISLKTAKARLEGEWELEKIEINGADVGYKYNDSLQGLPYSEVKFRFIHKYQFANHLNETFDILTLNKSSKPEEESVQNADVSGLGFTLFPKEETIAIVSFNKYVVIKDSLVHKIFFNLLFTTRWNIRALRGKKLVLEKNDALSNKFRLSFKKIRK